MLRPAHLGLAVLGLFTGLTVIADAAPMPSTVMSQPKRPTVVGAVARPKCEWSGALPPMPATCAAAAPAGTGGKEPTVAQCLDKAFIDGACGKTEAITKNYCGKVLFEDYCKNKTGEEELVFPSAMPKLAVPHVAKPGTPTALHIPPGMNMPGRQVPYTGLTKNGKAPPPTPNGGTAISEHTGATAINVIANGQGTFGSIGIGRYVPKLNSVRGSMQSLHQGLVLSGGVSNAQLEATNNTLLSQLNVDQLWVGNGANTPANMAVNSCAEYAYQRWFDYTHFKFSAKALGRNYRGIYALAVNPNSPVNLEKATLKQFGSGVLPKKWPRSPGWNGELTESVPHNPFFLPPSFQASGPITEQKINDVTARVNKYGVDAPIARKYMKAPGGSRFNTHKVLKQQLEARFKLSDDQIAERQARQDRYLELITARDKVEDDLQCARMPYACCSAPPQPNPANALHELLMKIQGWAVINPDPTKFASWGLDVGDPQSYNTWTGTEQALLRGTVRAMKGFPTSVKTKMPALGGAQRQMKQKSAGNGLQTTPPTAWSNTTANGLNVTYAPNSVYAGALTCEQEWTNKRPALEAAMAAIVKQLTDMAVKEYDLGAEGCLAEPVGGELGNSCDWSYEKFAKLVMSYMDYEVASDFLACNDASFGNFANVTNPAKQTFIYPCELRHNFNEDQHDVSLYVEAAPQKARRFGCEHQRAERDVADYLKANAELAKKLPVKAANVIGEAAGDNWTIGDRGTFGAFLTFGTSWETKKGSGAEMTDGAWCKPEGKSSMSGKAGFLFFGDELPVVDGLVAAETTGSQVFYEARGTYRDLDIPHGEKRIFEPRNRAASTSPAIQMPSPFLFLGDARADFWTSVGPIPLHIFFGGTAMAGLVVKANGTVSSSTPCADANRSRASDNQTFGFRTGAGFEPFARADAFGDASLDVGVAAAGLHIDLLLVRLGLPTSVNVAVTNGKEAGIDTGSNLSVDALSGRVSAYVRVGVPPLAATYEATLFGWDGIHDEARLWGESVTAPLKLLKWVSDPSVDTQAIKCISANQSVGGYQRSQCLKNVTSTACSPYPVKNGAIDEAYCDAFLKPYRLRGKPLDAPLP